jgi:hypothetical protein
LAKKLTSHGSALAWPARRNLPATRPAATPEVPEHAPPADAPLTTTERKSIRLKVMNLAWPSIVENFLQTMIGVVDTALVGH